MRYMKWIGLAAGILLIVACFSPWVIIESRNITVSGIDATGTRYGKPGYIHLLMAIFFLLLHFTPRLWAKRVNLLIVGINAAWVIRNFFLIGVCRGGECPVRQFGFYMLLLSSFLMLLAALFPDMELPEEKRD